VQAKADTLAGRLGVNAAQEVLKHESSVHCDALVSLPKPLLTDFVASLTPACLRALDQALRVALALG